MEYFIKEHIGKLAEQRESLVFALTDLNENLPNYDIKINNLDNQITVIDIQIQEMVSVVKDVKLVEFQNTLTIKTQMP